jgi:hypothetical protein
MGWAAANEKRYYTGGDACEPNNDVVLCPVEKNRRLMIIRPRAMTLRLTSRLMEWDLLLVSVLAGKRLHIEKTVSTCQRWLHVCWGGVLARFAAAAFLQGGLARPFRMCPPRGKGGISEKFCRFCLRGSILLL